MYKILDGRKEAVKFDKVTARVAKLCYGLDMNYVDPIEITRKVSILLVLEMSSRSFLRRSMQLTESFSSSYVSSR